MTFLFTLFTGQHEDYHKPVMILKINYEGAETISSYIFGRLLI
jgi:hypothetical protein